MQAASNRINWRFMGEAYVQQRTSYGWYDDNDNDDGAIGFLLLQIIDDTRLRLHVLTRRKVPAPLHTMGRPESEIIDASKPRKIPPCPPPTRRAVYPHRVRQVVKIVDCATRHQFVIIPFGGGTSVSGSVTCPEREERPIVALDTSEMNSILWIDKEQLLARVQTGIVGQDLEREMRARGLTVGHEPDSYEFSTLGGWVATRASGMKKNTYGNIEDLVVQTKTVTPVGVLEKSCRVPRISCGPEWEHVIMGSEGCFGVVTEVTLKVRPLPPVTRYGSLVFPGWEAGVRFEREVAELRLQPASIRLMDNDQFRFGLALKTETTWGGVILDGLKHFYITRIKGFDPASLCVVTLLIEGHAEEVAERERRLNAIAAKYGGVPAGAANGERGYTFTFVIAYIRDLAWTTTCVAESFETSVPWDRTLALCAGVKRRRARRVRATRRHALPYLLPADADGRYPITMELVSFEKNGTQTL
ncbi:hypothetical protein MSG28_004291 [Choristoneura fumiferana]|uniref:Uncharacterized protein n=1 Tax=Choristoneura fumiferana TaxID=7141 RepID=A0ACC0KIN9_CHOFU|nr:hypothetical protein MSG28_004291 [Choristoneura fumiferana]